MLSYMSLGNVKADITGEILIIGYLKAFISAEFTKVTLGGQKPRGRRG